MHEQHIKILEGTIENLKSKIYSMAKEPFKDQEEFLRLNKLLISTQRELSRLLEQQFEEKHERVGYGDDR